MAPERTPQPGTMDYEVIFWEGLVLLFSIGYVFFLSLIYQTWDEAVGLATSEAKPLLPFISIVVPARNEENGIRACLNAILQQNYPATQMEIIVVDDHSVDATVTHAQQITDRRLRVLSLSNEEPNQKGKKAALQLGIQSSKGNFIITTDADCTAPKQWLRSFAASWQHGEEMLLAPVRMRYNSGLLNAFQGLDVAGTLLLTGASVHWGRPLLSNGANFGFTKTIFKDLNGYQGNENRASGDDVFLLQKAVRAKRSVAFLYEQSALVDTAAAENWTTLFWQRLRWAGKTDAYSDGYLLLFQAAVFLYCALLCLLPFWLLPENPLFLLVAWGIKILTDFFFLDYACQQIGDRRWMRWFLPAQLLHTVYVFLLGCLALMPLKFYWKGRFVR